MTVASRGGGAAVIGSCRMSGARRRVVDRKGLLQYDSGHRSAADREVMTVETAASSTRMDVLDQIGRTAVSEKFTTNLGLTPPEVVAAREMAALGRYRATRLMRGAIIAMADTEGEGIHGAGVQPPPIPEGAANLSSGSDP
jgi:hypothetical protein